MTTTIASLEANPSELGAPGSSHLLQEPNTPALPEALMMTGGSEGKQGGWSTGNYREEVLDPEHSNSL